MITNPMEMRAVVFELTGAVWTLAAIGVLFDSGLGEQLAQPRTIDELAASCKSLHARRIEKVLGVAVAHGIVVEDGGRYRLAEGAVPVLCGPLKAAVAGDIRSHLMQPLAMLDSVTAGPVAKDWRHTDARILQAQGDASSVLPAMIKMQLAPQLDGLMALLELPGAKFLDVGTGVAALAIAACRVFPQVKVVGLDTFDPPLELARANVARAGVGDRVELRKLAVEDLRDEGQYALAWLPAFFISPATIEQAIARVAASLEPGGWMLMGMPGKGSDKQRAVNELVGEIWGGPTESPEVAEGWLRAAGLRDVRVVAGPAWAPQMLAGRR